MHRYKLIQQFRIVAELGNITQAAKALHISQPALTQNLHRLEESISTELLIRNKSGIELTDYGKLLYKHSCFLHKGYENAMQELASLKAQRQKTLRIGCGYVWSHKVLFRMLSEYFENYPEVNIKVITGESSALHQKLLDGEFDFILGAIPNSPRNRDELVNYYPMMDVKFGVFAHEMHPLSVVDNISSKQLESYQWVHLNHYEQKDDFEDPNIYPVPESKVKFEVCSLFSAFEILSLTDSLMSLPIQLTDIAKNHNIIRLDIESSIASFSSGMMHTANAYELEHVKDCIDMLRSKVSLNIKSLTEV